MNFDISCKLSPKETICMKCQILFYGKIENIRLCRPLKFLSNMLSLNTRKGHVCHMKITKVQIRLYICAVLSRHFMFVGIFCSIYWSREPWLDCVNAQVEQGLCCPHIIIRAFFHIGLSMVLLYLASFTARLSTYGMFEMNCLLSSSSISTWGTIKTNTYLYRAIQYLHNGV